MKKLYLMVFFILCNYTYLKADILQLDELKKGLSGKGYTVVSGENIEKFDFEIISIINSSESFGKVILAKLYGKAMEESGGISEGMSGSPLYIDGKLIGALSYTLDYDSENMAIITPIEDMLDIKKHEKNGYKLVEEKDIKPGTAVSISPVRGDISFDNLGTITLVENGEFWALGHAFKGKGNIKYFLNKAVIDYSIKNSRSPFKLGHSLETIGMVTQDRKHGVYGVFTDEIPTQKVNIILLKNNKRKNFSIEVIKDKRVFETYFSKIIENVLYKELDSDEYINAAYNYELQNSTGRLFYYEDVNIYKENLIGNCAADISETLLSVVDNPFEYIEFDAVNVTINLSAENKTAYINKMKIINSVLKPGDKLRMEIEYFVHQSGMKKQKIELKIPRNFKVGTLTVELSTGMDEQRSIENFESIGKMMRYHRERQKNNEISLKLKGDRNTVKTSINIPIHNYVFEKSFFSKDIVIDSFEAENDANEYFRQRN